MPHDEAIFAACRQLRKEAAKEQDSEKLRLLVVEINRLLDVIERRLAQLEGPQDPTN